MKYFYLLIAATNLGAASWQFSGSGLDAFCIFVGLINLGVFIDICTSERK